MHLSGRIFLANFSIVRSHMNTRSRTCSSRSKSHLFTSNHSGSQRPTIAAHTAPSGVYITVHQQLPFTNCVSSLEPQWTITAGFDAWSRLIHWSHAHPVNAWLSTVQTSVRSYALTFTASYGRAACGPVRPLVPSYNT